MDAFASICKSANIPRSANRKLRLINDFEIREECPSGGFVVEIHAGNDESATIRAEFDRLPGDNARGFI